MRIAVCLITVTLRTVRVLYLTPPSHPEPQTEPRDPELETLRQTAGQGRWKVSLPSSYQPFKEITAVVTASRCDYCEYRPCTLDATVRMRLITAVVSRKHGLQLETALFAVIVLAQVTEVCEDGLF